MSKISFIITKQKEIVNVSTAFTTISKTDCTLPVLEAYRNMYMQYFDITLMETRIDWKTTTGILYCDIFETRCNDSASRSL